VKAYYPAGVAAWDGPEALWPLIESVKFVNLPILGWLFAPLPLFGNANHAGWLFFALGLFAIAAAYVLLIRMGRTRSLALTLVLFMVNGPLI